MRTQEPTTSKRRTSSKNLSFEMTRSTRSQQKKQASKDGAVGGQSSESTEGLPGSQARHATLEEGNRSDHIQSIDYMSLFTKLAAEQAAASIKASLLQSTPGTPSEAQDHSSSEDDSDFSFPKRTARLQTSSRSSPAPVDLRNSFSALSDNEEEEQDEAAPRLTYKDKMPPVFLKLTPSQEHLDIVKSIIHADTRIHLQGPYLKIHPKDGLEYANLLTKARQDEWEYFTHSPLANDRTKFALKGLPTSTDCETIQTAFDELEIHVHHIRQMTPRQNPIPVWVLTTDKTPETRDQLLNLTGLLHFRVKIEDLKRRQTVTQCLRCQGFGHKATFCRLQRKCSHCAQLHDSRDCPNRESTPKCAGCGGDHFASSPDCPKRQKYSQDLKPKPAIPVTHPAAFPPLPTLNPIPQPPPPPPPSAWQPPTRIQ